MGKKEEGELFMTGFVLALFLSSMFNIGSDFLFEYLKQFARPEDYQLTGWLFISVGLGFALLIFWDLKRRGYFKKTS